MRRSAASSGPRASRRGCIALDSTHDEPGARQACPPPRRHRGRRVRRAVRGAQPRARPGGGGHARRPAQLPPVPADALPGGHRRPVARRDRAAAPFRAAQAAQHDGHPRRGGRSGRRGPSGDPVRRRADRIRLADRRHGRPSHVFRARRVEGRGAGPQDPRGRPGDPQAHPHRVRGRGTGSRSGTAARVDDVRDRRRRADRRRARGLHRRDRPRHAPPRLPGDQPGRRHDPPGRGDGSGPAALPARSLRVGPAPARAARRDGPHGHPRHGHRRAVRARRGHPGGRGRARGGHPGPYGAVGRRRARVLVRPSRRRGDRRRNGPQRPGPRRPGPDRARPSGDLRGRRCRRAAVEGRAAHARASPRAASRAARTRPA